MGKKGENAMKIVMIYDQIQAGMGAKDDKMVPLGILKETVGPAIMMESYLKQNDGRVMATLYCGNGTYAKNPDEVCRKLVAMVHKLNPDVVMCGPAFNYAEFAQMSARVAAEIVAAGKIPAIAAMSEENTETIEAHRDKVDIVRTPKKGGIGLNESLKNMVELARGLVDGANVDELKQKVCF